MTDQFRTEKDSMGELQVPANALYAAQTQRAIDNFPISGLALPLSFIKTVALIKKNAAKVNIDLGLLDELKGNAIIQASEQIIAGKHADQFPVDIFQTGSGTSTNMNVNEVLAYLASDIAEESIGANDHINMDKAVMMLYLQLSISVLPLNAITPYYQT